MIVQSEPQILPLSQIVKENAQSTPPNQPFEAIGVKSIVDYLCSPKKNSHRVHHLHHLFLSYSLRITACPLAAQKRARYTRGLSVVRVMTMAKAVRRTDVVLLPTGRVIRFFTPFMDRYENRRKKGGNKWYWGVQTFTNFTNFHCIYSSIQPILMNLFNNFHDICWIFTKKTLILD